MKKPYVLEFEIAGLPKMANCGHGNWRADHGRKMHWRAKVGDALKGVRLPHSPLQCISVRFTRCSSAEPDDDGLSHGFKPIRDALKFYGIVVDDRRKNLIADYRWEKAPPKAGKIKIKVEEIV